VLRFMARRLAFIPVALLLVNFFGFAYAHLVLPIRAARIPYLASQVGEEPLLPAYRAYLQDGLEQEYQELAMPGQESTLLAGIGRAALASLGLVGLALLLSVPLGLALGMRAVRVEPRRIAPWLAVLSSAGLAMPSFYIGSVLITAMFYYVVSRASAAPIPFYGFGWDAHLILPVLALMPRPTVHIARLTAGLLESELGKRHIVTARSIGLVWRVIRRRHALRSILAPVVLTVAGSVRLLMGDLILVEWLLQWPGLGLLFAASLVPAVTSRELGSELFLNPPVVATVLTVFAALFLLTDLAAAVLVRVVDPRARDTAEHSGTADVMADQSSSRRRNWPLLLGGLIVLCVLAIAIVGPALAPQDPMERHVIIEVEDGWERPPFPALTVPGFPLGSDQYGRDLLSWVLWAVRPTLIMVSIVALVRLVLGTWIGLLAGWSTGRPGRFLDAAIGGALSVPVLMVALGAIAAVGIEIGLLAFIIGLSATGWAETARLVRERTRVVRGHQYIEAAHALGESDGQVMRKHVLRQIMPMVWMLLALEISGTLMAVAGLGFLGYYVGGDVWVEVADYVAARTSGMPELGQMLTTANTGIQGLAARALPWAMVVAGSTVFVVVLGFNLLGEGLQRRLDSGVGRTRTLVGAVADRAGVWLHDRIWLPAGQWVRREALFLAVATTLAALSAGGAYWWQESAAGQPAGEGSANPASLIAGPVNPQLQWTFAVPAGVSGGPAVDADADGTVYVASHAGTLVALDPGGNIIWQASLPVGAVGSPALGPDGEIYVADKGAGLSAFSRDGTLRWRFQSDAGPLATAGPAVTAGGRIIYPIGNALQAVSAGGAALWVTRVPAIYGIVPPTPDPSGERLFWRNYILDARDGTILEPGLPVAVDQYIVGADGRTYLLSGHDVMRWTQTEAGAQIVEQTRWDYRAMGSAAGPSDAGVTGQRIVWLFYNNFYERTRVAWLDTGGRVLGAQRLPLPRATMVAVDSRPRGYVCGLEESESVSGPVCLALEPGSDEPVWHLALEEGARPVGGALGQGRLYVTFESETGKQGWLYAVADEGR
jgi:peptide/nickel transport system permease protein